MKKILTIALLLASTAFAKEIRLYYKKPCPYCKKVLAFLGENRINIEMTNIKERPEARKMLSRENGTRQVPCLYVDGKPLYESKDIIAFLKKEFVK